MIQGGYTVKLLESAPEAQEVTEEACKPSSISSSFVPIQPIQLSIMAVCVVVATLRVSDGIVQLTLAF